MSIVTTSNRIALSAIEDSQLNSSTPITDRYKSKVPFQDENSCLLTLTPSKYKRKTPELFARSFSIEKSATYYNKTTPALRSKSFASLTPTTPPDQSPSLHLKSSSSAFKNDAAGLAATKLRLKLQFALHKVNQSKKKKATANKVTKPHNDNSNNLNSNSHHHHHHRHRSKGPIFVTSPSLNVPTANASTFNNCHYTTSTMLASLPTPPEQPISNFYTKSINVNLQSSGKKNSAHSAAASLSKVAANKTKKRNQKLKLFQIKKSSIHYSGTKKNLPLLVSQNNDPQVTTSSLQLLCQPSVLESKPKPIEPANLNIQPPQCNILPSLQVNGLHFRDHNKNEVINLPSINNILKTPLRHTNFARSFRFQQSFNDAAPTVIASRTPTMVDETTIEEDNDMTLLQNSTLYNSTVDQGQNDTTINVKDDDETRDEVDNGEEGEDEKEGAKGVKGNGENDDDDDDEDDDEQKKTVLTSSPFNNHLGTPKSFSVAKSLLQLGGHRM
ncbi:uncharacterized protein LODBEIA_P30450 [Lodderomyces beijingensis]|uniref:Hap4 transcription factor heteromerisation domain-containing protein n=1 Tax=Lodderomyces beijingensis TaxID=1775926 RepID=A0ABP0ZPJ0_9ASCO